MKKQLRHRFFCVAVAQTVKEHHVHARRIGYIFLHHPKSPRQSFPARRRENKLKTVFSGDMCIGKNTSQPASVESGRPLTRLCMQRAATPRKNAGIFEKRVELFRHAKQLRHRFFCVAVASDCRKTSKTPPHLVKWYQMWGCALWSNGEKIHEKKQW